MKPTTGRQEGANVNNKVGKAENKLDLQNIEVICTPDDLGGKRVEAGCCIVILVGCWLRQWGAGVLGWEAQVMDG